MKSKILLPILLVLLLLSCQTKPEVYSVHTPLQEKALSDSWDKMTLYVKGDEERSQPEAVVINNLGDAQTIFISSDKEERQVEVKDGSAYIYNLFLGETYEWSDDSGERRGSFIVSSVPPRNMYVDGVTNFRDLGGWIGEDGERVNQGLLYRSARFSENETGDTLVTEKGRRVLLDEMKIKTEIDLRESSDGENGGLEKSPIGDEVEYISLPFRKGGGYLQQNLSSFPLLFEILGDEEKYPIVFHCSIGTDRTGAVAFVLEALLGMDEDTLYVDYLFSNFGKIDGIRRYSAPRDYLGLLDRFPGESLSEKAESMLLSYGVKEEDIRAFIKIMTE